MGTIKDEGNNTMIDRCLSKSLGFLILISLLHSLCFAGTEEFPVVSTTYGDVRGVRTNTARHFLGIPFASPPTGELR